MTRDDLAPDLSRTVALLGDGYRITAIARAKRAQERTEMLTAPISEAATRRDHEAAIHLARAIVRDAERLARTVGEQPDARPSICVHHDALALAALSLDGADRCDFASGDIDCTSVRVGPVQFFAAVRL